MRERRLARPSQRTWTASSSAGQTVTSEIPKPVSHHVRRWLLISDHAAIRCLFRNHLLPRSQNFLSRLLTDECALLGNLDRVFPNLVLFLEVDPKPLQGVRLGYVAEVTRELNGLHRLV